MSKPHEEEWAPEDVIVMCNRMDGQKQAREVLAHAAPDMVRALLDARRSLLGDLDPGNALAIIDAALTKAGVPLP